MIISQDVSELSKLYWTIKPNMEKNTYCIIIVIIKK